MNVNKINNEKKKKKKKRDGNDFKYDGETERENSLAIKIYYSFKYWEKVQFKK